MLLFILQLKETGDHGVLGELVPPVAPEEINPELEHVLIADFAAEQKPIVKIATMFRAQVSTKYLFLYHAKVDPKSMMEVIFVFG